MENLPMLAPRVTPELAEGRVVDEVVHHEGTLTIVVLSLVNGFRVCGTSACVSKDNFDADLGREIARRKAIAQVVEYEAYVLANRMLFERDRRVDRRLRVMASEAVGDVQSCRLTVLADDDLDQAKRILRAMLEPGSTTARLAEVLQLLTPSQPPVTVVGPLQGADPFADLLDRSIDEIVEGFPAFDTEELSAMLVAEYRGKTRRGLVKRLLAELALREAAVAVDVAF